MPIMRFPFSNGGFTFRQPPASRRGRCALIRIGIRSATILVFNNLWPVKNRSGLTSKECEPRGNMTPESETNLRLEIGHVLFIDLVGYSKLLIEDQKHWLRQLTDVVLATEQVREATNEQLVRLPT